MNPIREVRRLRDFWKYRTEYERMVRDLRSMEPRMFDIVECLGRDGVVFIEDGKIVMSDRPRKTIAREWLAEER